MTCFQITVTGSGSASPATVKLPGAYAASDPGILVDIHAAMSTYIAPGPTVYSGGSTKSAGAACAGCESTCAATSGPSGTAASPSATAAPTTLSTSSKTSAAASTTTSASGGGGTNCAAKYAQCGGTGWTGATCCVSGSTCSATNQVIMLIPWGFAIANDRFSTTLNVFDILSRSHIHAAWRSWVFIQFISLSRAAFEVFRHLAPVRSYLQA